MYNTYAVLYIQGTPTSAANVSAGRGDNLISVAS
jgi:hypothetical protein